MLKKKILLSIALVIFAATAFAQNVEVIDNEVRQTAYQGKSYLVVKSFTLQPPPNGSFTVSASANGPFFIKMYQPVADYLTNVPPNADKNYIRTETILQPYVFSENQIANLTPYGKAVRFDYFDGITRPMQNVEVKGSPSQKDVVQPVVYDANGRVSTQYYPYTLTSQNGAYRNNATAEQSTFYSSSPKVSADGRPFVQSTYENSALNRINDVLGSGDLWNTANKRSTASFSVNTTNIPRWEINTSGVPFSNTNYGPGSVSISLNTDEDNRQTYSYYDPRGQLIQTVTNATSNPSTLTTYYVYDDIGNLRFVIPPLLSSLTPTQPQLDNLASQYVYDMRQRLVKEKEAGPDNDWVFTIYDQWDRPVVTQDGLQRSKPTKEWSFIKYDAFNRPIITGVIQNNNTFDQMVAAVTGSHHEDRVNNSLGYTLTSSFPNVSESNVLTVQYYDDYAFKEYPGWDAEGNNFNIYQNYLTSVKGMSTGSKIRLLGQSQWLNSVVYYDNKYRAIESIEENHLGGIDIYRNKYAFGGWVTQSFREHISTIGGHFYFTEDYEYDHAGRLLKVYHRIGDDTKPRVLLASNSYNELGQLVESNLHSTDNGLSFLQSVDYRYNIRGWLTHINNSKLNVDANNEDTNDLFGMELTYNKESLTVNGTATTPLYNGSISAVRWKTDNKKDTPVERAYGFDYFDNNWFKKGNFASLSGATFTGDAGYYNLENLNYDANGNIQTLKRYGKAGASRVLTDDLAYGYGANGNQLTNVEDAGTAAGFTNGTVGLPTEYTYDKNANVTADLNNSITSVTYNYVNLPSQVVIDAPGTANDYTMEYMYDATGYAVRKLLKQGSTIVKQVDYVNGIQFVNGQLASIYTPSGRAVTYNNGSSFEYEYDLKDHLGNTRVTFGQLHEVNVYNATMETPNASQEESDFLNIAARRVPVLNRTLPTANVPNPNSSALVKASTNPIALSNAMGPAKVLTVKTGEKVSLQTFAQTISGTGGNPTLVGGIAGIVANSFGIVNGGETKVIYDAFQNFLPGYSAGIAINSILVPKAYICYFLLSNNNTNSQFGFHAIDLNAFNQWQKLAVNMTVPFDGTMFIYIANESTVSECYFDETQIVHHKLNSSLQVTQSADYDPFGYIIEGTRYLNTARLANSYLYQGNFSEFDEATGWNRFALRGNYDSRLGRWHSADPYSQYASPFIGMGNEPITSIDPDGGASLPIFNLEGALITGAASYGAAFLTGHGDDAGWWALSGFGLGGFLTSKFAKFEVWGTHERSGLIAKGSDPIRRKAPKYENYKRPATVKISRPPIRPKVVQPEDPSTKTTTASTDDGKSAQSKKGPGDIIKDPEPCKSCACRPAGCPPKKEEVKPKLKLYTENFDDDDIFEYSSSTLKPHAFEKLLPTLKELNSNPKAAISITVKNQVKGDANVTDFDGQNRKASDALGRQVESIRRFINQKFPSLAKRAKIVPQSGKGVPKGQYSKTSVNVLYVK